MNIKKIQNADVNGKNVLLRVDFNVSLDEKGDVIESHKILAAKESLEWLIENGARKIALLTHFGRPDGEIKPEFSVKQIADDVERILKRKVFFANDCIGEKVKGEIENGENQIILLENVRFYSGEKKGDVKFAKKLAEPFDIYVNDSFGVDHRGHASLYVITDILPSFGGIWLQKEIENLEKVKNLQKRPAVAIIGGSKIATKLPLIKMFEKSYNYVLVGGRVAVEAIEQGINFSEKVILPVDFTGETLDIGPKTIELFREKIEQAKTIVWNGPMGKFEEKPYDIGTRELVKFVAGNKDAFSLIGGGESVQALAESGYWEDISFVSTGGGAMLSFLIGEEMLGIEKLVIK
ncbi:MAG: phosphoglycerate kinase [Candidatus Moranbacteria bacterium]|nr:phosphoglycerate kinase [Candidatus Moranbacteria bacterium]